MEQMNNEKRAARAYYADTTANTAIGNIVREEKANRKEQETARRKLLVSDLKGVIREAKKLNCKTVNLYRIPIENLEMILAALRLNGR